MIVNSQTIVKIIILLPTMKMENKWYLQIKEEERFHKLVIKILKKEKILKKNNNK